MPQIIIENATEGSLQFSTYMQAVIEKYGSRPIWHPCVAAWYPLIKNYLRMRYDPLLTQKFYTKLQRGEIFPRVSLIEETPTTPEALLSKLERGPSYEDVFRVIRLWDEGVFNHEQAEPFRELLRVFSTNWVISFRRQLSIAKQIPNRGEAQRAIDLTMLYSERLVGVPNPVPEAVALFWSHQLTIPHTSAARKLLSDPFKYITELLLKSYGKALLDPSRVAELKTYFQIFNFHAPNLDSKWEAYIQMPLRFEDINEDELGTDVSPIVEDYGQAELFV